MSKIIVPGTGDDAANKKTLLDLWDQDAKTLNHNDNEQLQMLQKQNPKEFALARVNEIRRRLSKIMSEVVACKKLLPNTDVLDFIRDRCREKQLKFEVRPDAVQMGIMHIFVWDPKVEQRDLRPWTGPHDGKENWSYLGWVEKNTEPTPNRGDAG